MSKYKKIFSGLGLLSISTLTGASVVACANKKPKPSDSSTEGIDQNNNQGNSTTPEQGKPEMPQNPTPGTDHNNQGKNEDSTGKDNNGKTELEKDKKPEKTPEQGQNDKQKENKDESDKSDSNQIKKENEGKNTTPKDGKEQIPPKVMTVDEKVKLLNEFIVNIEYPNKNAPAKAKLKAKVTSIMNEENVKDDDKLKKLDELKTDLDQIKTKLVSVIKEIDDLPYPKGIKLSGNEKTAKDKFKEKLNDKTTVDEITKVLPEGWKNKITKYQKVFDKIGNFINTSNLRKRFVQTDDAKTGDKTESLLIYHVYETVRVWYPKNLKKLNNKDIEKKYADKFKETIKENNNKDVDWLLSKITEIIDEFSKAKNEINKKDTESTKKQN
ncbi:hypothetical protein RRG53_01410 [Mycoplasmopsis cynos]|uniref:hypothetical protein n=1 Tax=Mycoplasmopsis cynos TaxID=171284 RepID=UPI0021FF906D|nr:hypothetical protein [Mycoplasmopsis cynos]UWV93384.1 hypothetical protein NW062_05355 [Mycoplasmopsis cynos]WQQ18713.1 hypothetical protein RRG53_01410 [Mycoplasmopsis cynos]